MVCVLLLLLVHGLDLCECVCVCVCVLMRVGGCPVVSARRVCVGLVGVVDR